MVTSGRKELPGPPDLGALAADFEAFHARFESLFARSEPREQARKHLRALLGPVERRNGWQLAEASGDARPDATQRLLYSAVWSAEEARDRLIDFAMERFGDHEAIGVLDETGFIKKGTESVGVARQYSGTAGKIENCQIGVFLSYASARGHLLLDRRLYLPQAWCSDAERRERAHVPVEVTFQTKPQLAAQMLGHAWSRGVPMAWVTVDEVYGDDPVLRDNIAATGHRYVLTVASKTPVWSQRPAVIPPPGKREQSPGRPRVRTRLFPDAPHASTAAERRRRRGVRGAGDAQLASMGASRKDAVVGCRPFSPEGTATMCGLAGFLAHGRHVRPAPERRAILAAMGRQLASRGPDDEQTYDDGVLSLVFRRLSIVDVAGGRQPIWNERRSAFVAMNGEIWNHAALRETLRGTHDLASRSDAEVVVHLFEDEGPRLLDRLNGMFALAVWDREAERLLLARDRLGIKPLYYAWTPGGLLFGSELKALLVHPDCPAELRFHDLDLGYLGSETYVGFSGSQVPSLVEGVDLLPGGTYLEATPGRRPAPQTYWSLEPAIARALEAPPRPAAAYAEEYAALLVDAVRGQLMGDVPVGAFLSGGLDSSLICAIAAKQGQALPCFTVVERTTVDAGDVARARRLTEALDLPFHPVLYDHEGFAEQIGFSLASLESFVWMMDAPRFTPELLFKHELHRYAKTVVPDLKAMLLGQGADEFAGGYSMPRGAPQTDWDGYVARALSPSAQLGARGVPEPMCALVRPEALAGAGAPFHGEMRRRLGSLQALNLWNEDRIAAVQGVEARVPYLDHRLVEHLAAIPPALHRELFWDKAIVRRAAAGFLPDDIAHAPKVPFWLSGDASSVHAIMVDCARRCFPAFLEAYLGQPDSLFSASALVAVYARTRARAPDRVGAAKLLLACMTAAIFERLCRDLRRDALAIRPMGPPSPLGRASW